MHAQRDTYGTAWYVAAAVIVCLTSAVAVTADEGDGAEGTAFESMEALGEALFFDLNLSKNRTQSCATCHDPNFAFTDPRETVVGRDFSLGDDGESLGDRNTPTAAYAHFSPTFHKNGDGAYIGGQFLDGREPDLKGQAGGPPVNPIEMGMADEDSVVARLKENPDYVRSFETLFGADVFDDTDEAYLAMTKAIEAFEKTGIFSPFTSKYDRFLRGEAKLTDEEELGRVLFFSQQFTNCNQCHQLRKLPGQAQETFSNYEFHNIGVPPNTEARKHNGVAPDFIDHGLLDNPDVDDPAQAGKFKVPTLRNVAVTGPYMHNGVFKDLRTVIQFYNKFNSNNPKHQINPETGKPFREPEVGANMAMEELEIGPALDDQRIDALVAFLKTLTDERYEDLLEHR